MLRPNFAMFLFLLLGLSLIGLSSYAVPAKRVKHMLTLPDGSVRELSLCGDEFAHWFSTEDGVCFVQGIDGQLHEVLLSDLEYQREAKANVRNLKRRTRRDTNSFKGKKRGLVVLVNFTDLEMTVNKPQQTFNNIFNQNGYKDNGFYGSVHDYFYSCSYGQFDLEFDVVGPYTVSNSMAYYGKNDSRGDDLYVGKMIAEACLLADREVNFSDYDWDGDGYVDQVFVIYAGYGESQGAPANTIWPHEWDLRSSDYGKALALDGVKVDTYACSSELSGKSGSRVDGIGTACHEFSHCLGIPDFYDTKGTSFGMDAWDLMDYGCYNGDGYQPIAYTAYERWCCGWLEPVLLSKGCSVISMPPLSESPVCYVVYNDAHPDEFYLLQNIQKVGWDSGSYGHGLLVLHVDYSSSAWLNNTVNDVPNRQRMTIFHADNVSYNGTVRSKWIASLAGDPFPGTSGNMNLSDYSLPASSLNNMNVDNSSFMHKELGRIVETDGFIAFDFMGGGPAIDTTCDRVDEIKNMSKNGCYYDLTGKCIVGKVSHGMYIHNGRLFVK